MASSNAFAVRSNSPLAAMATTEESNVEAQGSTPYVGFYSKRAEKAIDVAQQVKGIAEGEPYLSKPDGSFAAVTSIGLVGPTFRYGCKLDTDYKITEAVVGRPERDSGLKEHVLAPILAYTKDGVTPTLTTFRPTKLKAALDLVNGNQRATDDACKDAGPVGKQLAKLPQPLRTVGDVKVLHKTSQSTGFAYQIARCETRLLSDVEAEHLANALNDQEFNELCAQIQSSYEMRKSMIESVAAGE